MGTISCLQAYSAVMLHIVTVAHLREKKQFTVFKNDTKRQGVDVCLCVCLLFCVSTESSECKLLQTVNLL